MIIEPAAHPRFSRRFRRVTALVVASGLVAAACTDSAARVSGGSDQSAEDTATAADGSLLPEVTAVDSEAPPAFVELSLDEKIEAFLEQPNSTLAANVAADMALDGDLRWGPWMLDLLRLGPSNLTDEQVGGALAILSGLERPDDAYVTEDYRVYGQWVYDQGIDPGDGYRQWKISLYSPIDEDYEALLGSVEDNLLLSRIQWGGVPRGGIPELNDPVRVSVAEATWMEPDEIVFGSEVEGRPVAYPFRILGHNELANDTIGETPVALVFCTLCRTALLFDRRVGDQVLDFETSGLLLSSNKIMVDVQTDTLWNHLGAVGIAGELTGETLDQFPVETTTWAEWVAAHPDTETLAIPDPIFFDEPEQGAIAYEYAPDSPYRTYYDDPDVWFPILDTPTGDIALKAEVLGLDEGGEQLALAIDDVVAAGPSVFTVGGRPLLVVPGATAGARVYDAGGTSLVDGDIPVISSADGDQAVLGDGSVLPRRVAEQGLWFAWFGRHPNTDWWPRS